MVSLQISKVVLYIYLLHFVMHVYHVASVPQ